MPVTFYEVPRLSNFRAAVLFLAPPWLAGNDGYRVLYTLAIQLDALAEYLRLGVLQALPTYCEEEALPHLGADRRIRRGPAEPASAYRARLRSSRTTWKYAGLPKTVLGQIAAYFAPNPPMVRYVSNGHADGGAVVADWWTLSGGVYTYQRAQPCNWDWDTNYGGRFWILVYTDLLSTWSWGDPGVVWGEPGLLWGYRGGAFLYDLYAIIDDWKSYGSQLKGVIIAGTDTTLFDPNSAPGFPMPNGNYGNPANRNPAAQYFFCGD